MIKWIYTVVASLIVLSSNIYAAALIDIIPSSTNPIAIKPNNKASLSYSIKNNSLMLLSGFSIEPNFGNRNVPLSLSLSNNQCVLLAPGERCTFTITIQGLNQAVFTNLNPRVCVFNGSACSVPVLPNRIPLFVSPSVPFTIFPIPYAGTFYPIYNSGVGQWIEPTTSMPFNRISAIFIAFAHTYPLANGAVFTYEAGQVDQQGRIARLSQVARSVNPSIKILISLGWEKNDWTYINNDYLNNANIFVPSVLAFIRANGLDGLDIDDEGIGGLTGSIPQQNFDAVIANLRNALNYASLQDGKPYYLTITPAGNNSQPGGLNNTQVEAQNANLFDLINIQTYYNGDPDFGEDFFNSLIAIGYPAKQIANGIDTEGCAPTLPPYLGLAGLFNWNMSADSACGFQYTIDIADLVGYYGA